MTRTTGKSFATLLQERIIAPLQLRHTAPNPLTSDFDVSGHAKTAFELNFARGYNTTASQPAFVQYPQYFGTAAGLTASVLDVARFKYPSYFCQTRLLYEAMKPIDPTTGKCRGWFLLRPRQHSPVYGCASVCKDWA